MSFFIERKEKVIILIINVHAGHNPDGKIACGAVGLIKESTEARKVKNEVIRLLKQEGHVVYDCTVENGTSQSNVLDRIITKCNAHKVNYNLSIHFNAGAKDKKGNKKTTGTEILLYSNSSKAKSVSESILKEIVKLGFQDRGIKYRKDLAFLRKTTAPAILLECCFVDDKDDVTLYHYKKMAQAIVTGFTSVGKKAMVKTSEAGIELIKQFEGCKLNSYLCPAGVWTIGYGHTKGVKAGQSISLAKAVVFLKEDLEIFEKAVNDFVTVPLSQNQFDALISFSFNVGTSALKNSTLRKRLNEKNYSMAANEFLKWNKSNGTVLEGLKRRREKERELFLKK